jgi:hypothetical protein
LTDEERQAHAAARPAAVYRLYDAGGALLYVGMSLSVGSRLSIHRSKARWWRDVDREEITWYRTAADARSAEARATAEEHPVHNVQQGRVIPGLGGPDAVLTEEEVNAWQLRDYLDQGFEAEFLILAYGYSQAEVEQALAERPAPQQDPGCSCQRLFGQPRPPERCSRDCARG